MPEECVHYIPNFVAATPQPVLPAANLPGTRETRIICVANLRPEKGHTDLLRAFQFVLRSQPEAWLLCAGSAPDAAHQSQLFALAEELGIAGQVAWLGAREDITALLAACGVGALSSHYEGLPLALLEYGQAGLAVACTQVGQCSEVLDSGNAGRLVPPGDPQALASALAGLLASPAERGIFSLKLVQRVRQDYSAASILPKIEAVYQETLKQRCPS
jgi:glycosyltransferase involved in cell wall biosynthesis